MSKQFVRCILDETLFRIHSLDIGISELPRFAAGRPSNGSVRELVIESGTNIHDSKIALIPKLLKLGGTIFTVHSHLLLIGFKALPCVPCILTFDRSGH